MPEDKVTLEMRVAALEDKLAKVHVTEEEMRVYEKVSSLLGAQQGGATPEAAGAVCQVCQISRSRLVCVYRQRQIVRFCYECGECGPCACGPYGGGFSGGGGFGGFGG